ncbi:MAG: Valyl-tRNA synthetase [Parcubacteria group bacterium GW2011_GWA1_47_11]|nr:MAG: Valyl-tRNA synthetase [Parcubacteria group bacterium GW2011_GWA1_47_11]
MPDIPDKFLKPYDPKAVEASIYKRWEESGYFNPDNLPNQDGEPFTIIMPPPNANGSLHAGHALFVTLQDIMVRFARMRGKKALWLPGADHAGFETQVVYEKVLEKEGRSRFKMEPQDLYKEILDFTLKNKSFMEGQLRQLGASCDWSRELFTLDERVVKTVYGTFKQLDKDGLLYRAGRTVNWCPKHQTSLSNLETEYVERTEPYWYIQYGPFVISTSRPETKFGDKYVVMHPEDKRYAQYKEGDTMEVEWINGPITATVIKDEAADMETGTGVMTITPWHDKVDFEIAQRHNLPYEQVIDEHARLLPIAGEFAGMKILEARPKIIEKLKQKGLLVKTDEAYTHSVQLCYKCGTHIEPQVRDQWFIKMETLAKPTIEAIEDGRVNILTEQHKKIALHWLHNIDDWNVSRQIVWGIPIPAWFKDREYRIGEESPGEGWTKDPDTFDTWFSSGQWPFVTLGFPDSPDFKTYYPTSMMETGTDILFFWVVRMIMLGLYRTNEVPFKKVYLHGLVRDAKGQKMSKSKGNIISPLVVSDEYGTDALRMGLVVGNTPGTDLNLDPQKIGAYRKFANKLWNITRFVLSQEKTGEIKPELKAEFDALAVDVTKDIEGYRIYMAAEKLYHYVWDRFAAEIIEESKGKPQSGATLHYLLENSLKLLHPFMPFVTEEIWSSMPESPKGEKKGLIMVGAWPTL